MADNRYTIDVILDFKDKFTQSIRDATRNTESLDQALAGLERRLEQQETQRRRLADVTTDQETRSERLADAYEREFGALEKKVQLTEETARAQYNLAQASRAYADAEKERGFVEERSLVNQNLLRRRLELAQALVEAKKEEIDLATQQALAEDEEFVRASQNLELIDERIQSLEKEAEEQEKIIKLNKDGNEERKKQAEADLGNINRTIGALRGQRTQFAQLRAEIKAFTSESIFEEYANDALRLSEAFEDTRLESRKLELQNKETTKSQEEQARSRKKIMLDLDREAKKLRESGFADTEANRQRKKNLEELRKAYEQAGGSVEDFEAAQNRALQIRNADLDRITSQYNVLESSIRRARQALVAREDAAVRSDEVAQVKADLDYQQAIRQAEEAKAFINGIFEEVKVSPELDNSRLIADLPEYEAIRAILSKDINAKIEWEVDNLSLTKTIGILEALPGLGQAIGEGLDKGGRGVSNFDNLLRGLFTLTIALFFQQILISVVGLAAGLAALASSAVAAGAALGGALAAGALQAAPAIGVLAAFANRVTSVFGAVKQANLLQQQESYKGARAAGAQAQSLDGVVSAQERVKDAQDKVTEARKKAREALEDLILQEQRQSLSLEKAEENLQKALSSGGSFAVQQARIDVAEASNTLGRTRTNLDQRRRQGISGSPEVTEAQKNLREAQRALAQARQSATQAGGAIDAATGKLNFLLGDLSKAEKNLYQAILRLQKVWLNFSQTITEPLIVAFTGAIGRVTQILRSSEIVNLGKSISNGLASSFREAFNFLLSDEVISRIAALGQEFVGNLRPLTRIVINLTRIFLDLAELGSPVLEAIIDYLDKIVFKFAEFTNSSSGRNFIADLFKGGTEALIQFVDLLGAAGNVLFALIGPAGGLAAGNNLLRIFTDYLNKLATGIRDQDSRVGQFFRRFFAYADDIVLAFRPIVLALAGLIDGIFTPAGIRNVEGFGRFLGQIVIPALGTAAAGLAKLTTAFVTFLETVPGATKAVELFLAAFIFGGVFQRVAALANPLRSITGYLFLGQGKTNIFQMMRMEADKSIPVVDRLLQSLAQTDAVFVPRKWIKRRRDAQLAQRTLQTVPEEALESGGIPFSPIITPGGRREGGLMSRAGSAIRSGPIGRAATAATGAVRGRAAATAASLAINPRTAGIVTALQGLRAGPVVAAIAAITAAIVGLIAIAGRLGDVWRSLTSSISGVFSAIKDEIDLVIRDVKEIFDSGNAGGKDFESKLKAIGNVLADIVIPAIKILVGLLGGVLLTGFKIIGGVVRALARILVGVVDIITGFVDIVVGIFTRDGDKIKQGAQILGEGILRIFQGIGGLLLDILTAPFAALGSIVEKLFISATDKVKGAFDNVLKFVFDGIDFLIDKFNKIAPKALEVEKINYETAQERQARQNRTVEAEDTSSGGPNAGRGSRRVDARGRRVTNRRQAAGRERAKANNEDAENFLSSFNPETVKLSDEITKKLSRYWRTLRREARTAADYVSQKLNDIRKDGGKDIDRFVTNAQRDVGRMRRSFRTNFLGIAAIVRNQMVNVSNIVANQMQNASMAVYKGAKYMRDTLNDALKSVGANEVELSIKVPKIREEKRASGGFVGRANGGWIGNRGERGRDAVPTLLGRGEAVLNWGQQRVVEPALRQTYGFGLDEMFSRTQGYHAGGRSNSPGYARGRRGARDGVYTASVFNDAQGYKSDSLANNPYNWAELGVNGGVGNAFGGLPYKTQIKVSYKGRSVNLTKLDIGSGGPGLGGKIRAVDIWQTAANKLRLPGLANVYVSFSGKVGRAGKAAEEIAMPKIEGGSKAMRDLVSKSLDKYRKAANRKIERETPVDVTGSGGDFSIGKGIAGSLRGGIALARRLGLTISSTNEGYPGDGVHTPTSWHYRGRALDAYGSPAQMAAFFRAALRRYGRNILELFYDPLGAVKNGQRVAAVGNHTDHVHLALARGGRITEKEKKRLELARKEKIGQKKYDMMDVRGLKKFASGGSIDGPDGQAVPIMAHAGEWVLNKRQQNMVAGIAGTTADRLKGMLGFSGGPTYFQGGGEPKAQQFKFPNITIDTSRTTFERYLNEFGSTINKLVKNVLSTGSIEKTKKRIEDDIKRLEKGGTTDKEDARIEKLKERLKNIDRKAAVDNLLSAVRQVTGTDGESGAVGIFLEGLKRTFDRVSAGINLGAAGFKRILDKGIDKVVFDPTSAQLDPVKIAEDQAKAQAELRDGLLRSIRIYSVQIAKLQKAANRIGRRRNSEGKIVTLSLDRLNSQQEKDQKELDKLEKNGITKDEKKRVELLKKRIASRKKEIDAKALITSEINSLEEQRRAREQEAIEAENARLEAEKTAFEEQTKKSTRDVELSDAFNNFIKSVGELTGNSASIAGALRTTSENAQKRRDILQQRLADAEKLAASDPRWQSVVDDLAKEVLDANLAVVQAQSDIIENSISEIENTFQRTETTRGLAERRAAIADKLTAGGGNAIRRANLESRGTNLREQRNDLQRILDAGNLNAKQAQELQEKINDLSVAIEENTQEIIDLNLQLRQQSVERITGISSRTGSLLGNAGSIFENISRTLGEPNTRSQISVAESLRSALGLERTSLANELTSFLADPNSGGLLGPEAGGVLQQLLTAFNSGDPGSFATTLQALSPQIALLESTLGESARGPFAAFIDSLTNNTIAITDNTANLAELNGLANQPQPFSTTAWTRFRAAIFNGLGDVLPQFDIPQMATGGYISKGGLFELHPGEFVVNANQSNVPDAGDINITVNEANKPLDVTALASRIAFEKRTRR